MATAGVARTATDALRSPADWVAGRVAGPAPPATAYRCMEGRRKARKFFPGLAGAAQTAAGRSVLPSGARRMVGEPHGRRRRLAAEAAGAEQRAVCAVRCGVEDGGTSAATRIAPAS